MLVSTDKLLLVINSTLETGHLGTEVKAAYNLLKRWTLDLVQGTPITPPFVKLEEQEKAAVLYCSEELWAVVQRWQNKNLKTMGFLDFVKLWKEIKPILEKGE